MKKRAKSEGKNYQEKPLNVEIQERIVRRPYRRRKKENKTKPNNNKKFLCHITAFDKTRKKIAKIVHTQVKPKEIG